MAYFAHVDPSAPEPSLVSFYDTGTFDYPNLPPAAELHELTPEQWAVRMQVPYFAGGAFVARPALAGAALGAVAMQRLGLELAQCQGAGVSFTPAGATAPVMFGTTPTAMQMHAAAASLGMTIALNGTPVLLTPADAAGLLLKANGYLSACVSAYATLHAAVLADPATDVRAGWPSNL